MKVLRSVDTIADVHHRSEAAAQDARRERAGIRATSSPSISKSGFTSAASGGALAPEHWDALPSRVEPTTRLLLDLLDRANVRATFFVVGWVAERYPRLDRSDARLPATRSDRTAISTQRAYELGPDAFRRRSARERRGAARRRRARSVSMFRAPEWSINDRSLWALDVLVEEGLHGRRQHGAGQDRRRRSRIRAILMYGKPAPGRSRGAAAGRRSVRPGDADRLGLGPAHELAAPGAARDRGGQPARAARGAHRASLGARSRSAARAACRLGLHFAHYFRLGGFRERLRAVLEGATFGRIGDMAAVSATP